MRRIRTVHHWIKSFLSVIGLTMLLIGYQNFSSLSETSGAFDIREVAPIKPADLPNRFNFQPSLADSTPEAVGQHLLSDQATPYLKEYEKIFLRHVNRTLASTDSSATGSADGSNSIQDPEGTRLKFYRVNSMGLEVPRHFKVTCSVDTNKVNFRMSKDLSTSGQVFVDHEAIKGQSSVNFSYSW